MAPASSRRWLTAAVVLAFALYVAHRLIAAGGAGEQPSLIVSALVFTAFGLLHGMHMLGWRRALAFFGTCSVLSWAAESHSIASGNVGAYVYTDVLGPKLGQVPWVIPLTWFLMLYPAYVIANLVMTRKVSLPKSSIPQALWLSALTAVTMSAWDLSLDPYMSGVVKAWIWEDGGPYFGVPFANYYGWVTVSFGIILVYRLIERLIPLQPVGAPSRWIAALPIGIYAFNMIGDLLVGEPLATRLIALFAMSMPVLAALARLLVEPLPDDGPLDSSASDDVRRVAALVAVLLGIVVLAFHLWPLLHGTRVPFTLLVPVFAAFSFVHAGTVLGWARAGTLLLVAGTLSLLSEFLGTTSGVIFGRYHYTDVLGFKLFGEVPWVIPLTWFLMIYPSYLIANLIVIGRPSRPAGAAHHLGLTAFLSLVTAMTMTAWDVTLDPYMVGFEKAWVWEDGGPYFGVPFHNYVGWVGTVFVVMMVYRLAERRIPWRPTSRLTRHHLMLPLLTYAFMAVGDVVLGFPEATQILSPFVMGLPFLFAATVLWTRDGAV